MAFANFILVVFLVVSLLVFVVLVLLLRQIKKDGRLPADKLTTLGAILFIPAILIFALVSKSISNWHSYIQMEKERVEVSQFVNSVYPPLAVSQESLVRSFAEMRSLLQQTQALEREYPNHAGLISSVTKQWNEGQSVLYDAYNNTDKEIRRAWISYNTMDQQDVLSKFSKQAVHLETDIKKAEKSYQRKVHSVQDEIIKNIDNARKLLDMNRKLPKSKKRKALNKATQEKIYTFSDRTVSNLIVFLGSIDGRLKEDVESLKKLINIAGQQSEIIRAHLIKNQDLEKPLKIIISDWKKLEADSQLQFKQIMYAVEAEYIAKKLGLSKDSPAIKAMHKSLLLNIPSIVGKVIKKRNRIDQSYKIKQ